MIVAPTDIWHDKREDNVCFSLLSVTFCQTISLSMLYECLPVTEMHINIHKRFEDVHNKAQNWNGQERTRKSGFTWNCFKFFLHFVVEKNWMRGVKNTCGGAWEPILFFFFWPYLHSSLSSLGGIPHASSVYTGWWMPNHNQVYHTENTCKYQLCRGDK